MTMTWRDVIKTRVGNHSGNAQKRGPVPDGAYGQNNRG